MKESKMTQMEGYIMFSDWKNRYCQNDYITQSNLEIQGNPYQVTNGISQRTRTKKTYKFVWKHKRLRIAKAILRKTKQQEEARGSRLPDFDCSINTKLQ